MSSNNNNDWETEKGKGRHLVEFNNQETWHE
jgi:hypothetical protein